MITGLPFPVFFFANEITSKTSLSELPFSILRTSHPNDSNFLSRSPMSRTSFVDPSIC